MQAFVARYDFILYTELIWVTIDRIGLVGKENGRHAHEAPVTFSVTANEHLEFRPGSGAGREPRQNCAWQAGGGLLKPPDEF